MSDLLIKRSAVLSADAVYRLRLDRDMNRPGHVAAVFAVNPSTADGDTDDQMIRKLYGFSDRLGIGRFMVGNKFAYRATDVSEVGRANDPVGPENNRYLEEMFREADLHIVAWGTLGKLPPRLRSRWREVVAIADRVNVRLMCLGIARDGHPLHPQMLAYDRALVEWQRPE